MKTHDKKLRNLTKSLSLPFTTTETVHNLSSKLLTTDELEVLKYGLKHSIHPLQINKTDILTIFDVFTVLGQMIVKIRNILANQKLRCSSCQIVT